MPHPGLHDFVHQALRTRLVARPGAALELGAELQRLGCRRPLLLASRRTMAGPLMPQLLDSLGGLHTRVFAGIPPHSSVATVSEAADAARQHGADALVAVGGGSVCDTAKAAALLLAEGGPLARHASHFVPPHTFVTPELRAPKLPIVSIPMTASGAEVTPSLGIRGEDSHKLLFWDARLASRVVLLDPQASLDVPATVLLATGMNGLAHCLEGLYSRARSPISTVLALDGIVRFDRALRAVACHPHQVAARSELLLAAHLSGMVLASARSCLHHAICHVLGATTGLPHGELNAVLLPHALAFNVPAATELLAPAARHLGLVTAGSDAAAAQALPAWVVDLQHATGVPRRLRDLGVDAAVLRGVAERTLHERGLALNPVKVADATEIERILHAAW